MICSLIVAWKACIAAHAGLLSCDLLPILLSNNRNHTQITHDTFAGAVLYGTEAVSLDPHK